MPFLDEGAMLAPTLTGQERLVSDLLRTEIVKN
jgi:hypothetical protein